MVLKRQLSEGGEEGSDRIKHRHLVSNIFKGLNHGRTRQEFVSSLEPIFRKWVREEVSSAMDQFMRSSYKQVGDSSGLRSLQLDFHGRFPRTLFTGTKIVSEDSSPMRVVLYDNNSRGIISSGPLSSLKVAIVVLDGDFEPGDREDWTSKEFRSKIVKNREGKRPLVTGELMVTLQGGVGYIGDVTFTDNSSWMRSGKFRLGAKVHSSSDEVDIREAASNAFKVKDHRGESYQKHYPPSLNDQVWRLERIAKDGPFRKKLNDSRVSTVRDFLRLYATNQSKLRAILQTLSDKTWEAIVKHAKTCALDDERYMYRTAQGTGLLFNSIYNVVGVTFDDGLSYHSVESLSAYQKRTVEDLKRHAYKNLNEWLLVREPLITGYSMLAASPSTSSFTSPSFGINFQELDQRAAEINSVHPTTSQPYKNDDCIFEFGESSNSARLVNQTLMDVFGRSDTPGGFNGGGYNNPWASGENYESSQLSTDDLPIDDNFQVGNEIRIISSNSGIHNPRNQRPKTRWCKVLAVVKWRILVRRNVASRKWNSLYGYM